MIYDCFIFNNELDLLEIRLNELDNVVDKFVIVESNKTFSNKSKPLYFEQNKARYKKFLYKITHIIVDNFNESEDITQTDFYKIGKEFIEKNFETWKKEVFQRNAILKGLKDCKDNDVIIIGDLDEIPNKDTFHQLKNLKTIKAFEQKNYYYYFNCQGGDNINCCRAVLKKNLTTPQEIRFSSNFKLIKNGGWHFSFLGGTEAIKEKIKAFSHQEYNTKEITDIKRIEFNINNGLDIFDRPIQFKTIKDYKELPKYILKNINKYKKYFKSKIKSDNNSLFLTNEIVKLRKEKNKLEIENQNINEKLIQKINELKIITDSKLYKLWPLYEKIKKYLK